MSPTLEKFDCSQAMEIFHRVLDGDLMDAEDRTRMESHVAVCSDCAEQAAQLREMIDMLRGIAEAPMPDEALQHVRARTVDVPRENRFRRAFDWRFAAAAAMIVLVTWVGLQQYPRPSTADEEALRAAREARLVLQLTANALKRTEQVTVKEVFADEISPALEKLGVRFPSSKRAREAEEVEL